MNKALVITLLIGLLAGSFIHSGEAIIRAGRNMVPFPAERDGDAINDVYDRAASPQYFKRGMEMFLLDMWLFHLSLSPSPFQLQIALRRP